MLTRRPAVFRSGRIERQLAQIDARLKAIEFNLERVWATFRHFHDATVAHNDSLGIQEGQLLQLQNLIDPEQRIRPFEQFDRGFGLGARWKK